MKLRIIMIVAFCGTLAGSQTAMGGTKPSPAAQQVTNAAAPPAPDLPRANYIQQMNAEFKLRDLDGDGKITRAELERFERNDALAKAKANNQALFLQLDKDHNGALSPDEFAALAQDPGFIDVSRLMQRLDPNRDQIVTLIEFRTATLANFDQLDTDKDGVVTDAEMHAANPKQVDPSGR